MRLIIPVHQTALCLLFGLVLLSFQAAAESEAAGGEVSDDPLVFTLPGVYPWAMQSESGEDEGILVDLVQALEQRSDMPLEYRIRPLPRNILELRRGEADYSFMFEIPDAETFARPVNELMQVRILLIGPVDAESVDSLADMEGANIGYIRGSWVGDFYAREESIHAVPIRDFSHGLQLIARQRLEGIVIGEIALMSDYEPEPGDPPIRIMTELSRTRGLMYFSSASDRQDSVPAISRVMRGIIEDGTLDTVMHNWFRVALPAIPGDE